MKRVVAAFVAGLIVGAAGMSMRARPTVALRAINDSLVVSAAAVVTATRESERLAPAAERSSQRAFVEHATYDSLRSAVTVNADTVMTPDSRTVDFRLSEMIRAADRVAFTHEAAIDSLSMALAAETARANAWQAKAELLERKVALIEASRPRFGFRSGVAVGAAGLLAVIYAVGSLAR